MKKRIITGIILLLILAPALIFEPLLPVLDIIIGLLLLCGVYELLHMYEVDKKIPISIKISTYFLTFFLYLSILNEFSNYTSRNLFYQLIKFLNLTSIFTPIVVLLSIFIILMFIFVINNDFTVKDLGRILIAITYIGLCFSAFTVLRYLGKRYVFYLLIITSFTDIFALVFGMLFGKHKMAPQISPKKTWEGAIGGSVVATILGFIVLFFYKNFSNIFHNGSNVDFFYNVFNYADFSLFGKICFTIILTLFLSICGQLGDLVASKLKRYYGIKDYSNIFPGHGGILDRFDSGLFAASIFFIFMIFESNLFPVVAGGLIS